MCIRDSCRLVNAKQDGSETGDGVDHTDADWITRAQYNLSYVTQPNIVLATYKRKGQWLPRIPGLLVQMAVDDDGLRLQAIDMRGRPRETLTWPASA